MFKLLWVVMHVDQHACAATHLKSVPYGSVASALLSCTMRPLTPSMMKGPAHALEGATKVGMKGAGLSLPRLHVRVGSGEGSHASVAGPFMRQAPAARLAGRAMNRRVTN